MELSQPDAQFQFLRDRNCGQGVRPEWTLSKQSGKSKWRMECGGFEIQILAVAVCLLYAREIYVLLRLAGAREFWNQTELPHAIETENSAGNRTGQCGN